MTRLFIASAALISLIAPAIAQPRKPAPTGAAQGSKAITRAEFAAQAQTAFAASDTNHDGYISLAEVQAAQARDLAKVQEAAHASMEAQFRRLDTNHDGQLSLQEFEAAGSIRSNVTAQQIVQQLDTNHDGKISADEYKAPRMRLFDSADTNHDGVVSPAEAAAAQGAK